MNLLHTDTTLISQEQHRLIIIMNSPPSPRKRRFQAMQANDQSNSPPRPSKRQTTFPLTLPIGIGMPVNDASAECTQTCNGEQTMHHVSATQHLYQFTDSSMEFNGDEEGVQPMTELPPPAAAIPIPDSYEALEDISHNNRLALQAEMTRGKGTELAYARHLKDYIAFWDSDQVMRAASDLAYQYIPCFPITATKVAIYLAYATKRGKVRYFIS